MPVVTSPETKSDPCEGHAQCTDCREADVIHYKNEDEPHCMCGESWINGKCESLFSAEDYAQFTAASE